MIDRNRGALTHCSNQWGETTITKTNSSPTDNINALNTVDYNIFQLILLILETKYSRSYLFSVLHVVFFV